MTGKPRILLIEDDVYILDVYADIFSEAGFEPTTAIDGEVGLQKISDGGYDLILLDVMMPKLDGLGVLAALKKTTPKKPNGPIVLLTNLGHDPIIKEALSLGAKGFLIKSDLDPDQLVAEAKKYLKQD